MREAEIYDQLTEIFREVFSNPNMVLKPELAAKDVQGWDSFRQVEIVIAVEEKCGVKFRGRELDGLRDVGDLASAILAKTAGQ